MAGDSQISGEVKKQVLRQLSVPGCIISGIASRYGISRSTLYKWRKRQALGEQKEKKLDNESTELASKFIELSLREEATRTKLTKAELVFDSFSLLIEGNFSSNKLLKIISVMES
jgi:transposase-like protein